MDDKWFEDIFKDATCEVETFGFSDKADIRATDVKHISRPGYLGVQYHVAGLMDFDVEIDIPGDFSVYNSLTAIAVCRHFGVPVEDIKKALKVARVKGRIEMIKVSDDFTLMIDYAHNAMALESLLDTLRDYHPERIVTVFRLRWQQISRQDVMRWAKYPVNYRTLRSSHRTTRDLKSRRQSLMIL